MTGRRAMWLIVALALASAGGIIATLLTDGPWDAICLVLAALPLAIGSVRRLALRKVAARARSS
ncbi:MAG: hypothetical protein GEV06_23195 [Luteitalea sp.]|nr:hypothetical protein [Luteitalea sp.]